MTISTSHGLPDLTDVMITLLWMPSVATRFRFSLLFSLIRSSGTARTLLFRPVLDKFIYHKDYSKGSLQPAPIPALVWLSGFVLFANRLLS